MSIIEKYADLKVDNERLNRLFSELALCVARPERIESLPLDGKQPNYHYVVEFLYYLYAHHPQVFDAWLDYRASEFHEEEERCKPLWRKLLRL